MAEDQINSGTVTAPDFYEQTQDFIEELKALFKMANADVLAIIQKGEREGWTGDQIIREIENLF